MVHLYDKWYFNADHSNIVLYEKTTTQKRGKVDEKYNISGLYSSMRNLFEDMGRKIELDVLNLDGVVGLLDAENRLNEAAKKLEAHI